jgi:hypothetical protein
MTLPDDDDPVDDVDVDDGTANGSNATPVVAVAFGGYREEEEEEEEAGARLRSTAAPTDNVSRLMDSEFIL